MSQSARATRTRAPQWSPPPRRKRRAQNATPGPGSYNLDRSPVTVRAPGFSFGSSGRAAAERMYLSKQHAKSSSMYGKQSPGPATLSTRGAGRTHQKASHGGQFGESNQADTRL